jgi:amino acid transporter
LGIVATTAQSIASMAPAAAIAFGLGAAVPHAGAALPLAVVIAMAVCTIVALSLAKLAAKAPSAGGQVAAIGHALGPRVGWLAGWLASFAYLLVTPATLLVLALFTDSFLREGFHVSMGAHGWIVYVLVYAAIVALLTGLGVKVSSRATMIFGVIELLIFLALAITLIVSSPAVPHVFTPSASPTGWSGVLFGMLFVFSAFIGFESSTTYGEETRAPERVIPRAVVGAAIAIGGVFVLCAYAAVAGWGPEHIDTYFKDLSPWITMSMRVWGPAGAAAVIFAILNSGLGGTVVTVNAGGRILYAMAREGSLPKALAATTRRQTPIAVLPLVAIGAIIAIAAGLIAEPINGLIIVGASSVVPVLLVYIAICVGAAVVAWRERRIVPALVPLIAAVALGGVIYMQFVPRPAPPQDLVGPIDAVWLVIGLAVLVFRKA